MSADQKIDAILVAKISGFKTTEDADDVSSREILQRLIETADSSAATHGGKLLGSAPSGFAASFESSANAVRCAISILDTISSGNTSSANGEKLLISIGIDRGPVSASAEHLTGDGFRSANQLARLAGDNALIISEQVIAEIRGALNIETEKIEHRSNGEITQTAYCVVSRSKHLSPPETSFTTKRLWNNVAIAAGLAIALMLVAAVTWQNRFSSEYEPADPANYQLGLPDKPSIAVLPFTNMSDDSSQQYFADGMAEDLITDLSQVSGLFVIARNSTFSYKGKAVKIQEVAEELGVRYIVEGSVRKGGGLVRINAKLIDAISGGNVWAERFDGPAGEVFELQDKVIAQIVSALSINLTGEDQIAQNLRRSENFAAHDAFLHGWAHSKISTPADLAKSIPFFEEAIRLDPDYSDAHAALASVLWDIYKNDWAFDLGMLAIDTERRAQKHLEEALQAPTPLAHALQSRIFSSYGFVDAAVQEAEKAVLLSKNSAPANAGLALALVQADRSAEAIASIRKAMRLDPHFPPGYLTTLGAAQFGMEDFNEAISTFERAAKRNPSDDLPLIFLASSLGHLGKIDEADATIRAANDVRFKTGKSELSLERISPDVNSPFRGEIEYLRVGVVAAQERLRSGLMNVPEVTWQYKIKTHSRLGFGNTSYEVEGATSVDLKTAKSLYDEGAVFVETGSVEYWKEQHIPGSVHLPVYRTEASPKTHFTKDKLMAVASPDTKIVIVFTPAFDAWDAAKAVVWGYKNVYFFDGGANAWKEAGYPVESEP